MPKLTDLRPPAMASRILPHRDVGSPSLVAEVLDHYLPARGSPPAIHSRAVILGEVKMGAEQITPVYRGNRREDVIELDKSGDNDKPLLPARHRGCKQ